MDIQDVYNNIANDFSNTRYKPWKPVAEFIDTFNETDINCDIGCGNGKNMLYRKINFKGIDICDEFVKICNQRNLDVIKGNILDIPFQDNYFDNIICIAVIHHLKDIKDRINAIKELFRICKKGGKIMIYVWAYEQPDNSKRKFYSCDEMVSYKKVNGEIFYRYYHLYKKNELEEEIKESNIKYKSIISQYNNGNWYIILEK